MRIRDKSQQNVIKSFAKELGISQKDAIWTIVEKGIMMFFLMTKDQEQREKAFKTYTDDKMHLDIAELIAKYWEAGKKSEESK